MDAIRRALRMVEAADKPRRPCDQEWHEAAGGKGQCVHLYDGQQSACGRKAPTVSGQTVTVAECASDSMHFDGSVGFYWHSIGFTHVRQLVTCLACLDKIEKAPSVSREG